MKISVAFDVLNHVEVMEGWPITRGDMTFILEREDNLAKKVIVTFSDAGTEIAPRMTHTDDGESIPIINIRSERYVQNAINQILNWQAVVSGLQVFDLDFDGYELQFHAENIEEENQIAIKSFRQSNKALSSSCDFEQIGRAFCVGAIPSERIEYTAHYRDGRLALEAGRNIDAYNNMFLFLETRFCDGKTQTDRQTELLSKNPTFVASFEQVCSEYSASPLAQSAHLKTVFDLSAALKDRIKIIINLRGKLRHHSLKSPLRWDPNKQGEYEEPARFLTALVMDIVTKESLADIYSPKNLDAFRELSVNSGFETKVGVRTYRLNNEKTLDIEMSFPTTVVSSMFCHAALTNALVACEKHKQIGDTTKLEATHKRNGLELFEIQLGIWAFTENRKIAFNSVENLIICRFEHFLSGIIVSHEFEFPVQVREISIQYAWALLKYCLDRVQHIDPTTRVMSLKLFAGEDPRPLLTYRVGAQVMH